MEKWEADVITTPPTIDAGMLGRAWKIDTSILKPPHGCVVHWLVEAGWAHPFWHSYHLSMIHLRPIEDTPPPTLYLPGATHEIVLQALNPDQPRQPAIDKNVWHYLTPTNFCSQMIYKDDAEAIAQCDAAAKAICEGRLSPDTDYIRYWVALFGDNMLKDRRRGLHTIH